MLSLVLSRSHSSTSLHDEHTRSANAGVAFNASNADVSSNSLDICCWRMTTTHNLCSILHVDATMGHKITTVAINALFWLSKSLGIYLVVR